MSTLVRKGIEQAQEDLRRETDDALWQEGILRHVPIVGSIYNWISPIQKVNMLLLVVLHFTRGIDDKHTNVKNIQPQVKGRYLSLKEGKVDSTESIYNRQLKKVIFFLFSPKYFLSKHICFVIDFCFQNGAFRERSDSSLNELQAGDKSENESLAEQTTETVISNGQ